MSNRNNALTGVVGQRDAVLPLTRVVAAIIIPFLVAAFMILYLRPAETGQRFAWEIKSPLTAALMGAGYLGGAYFFARVLFEPRWSRVAAGFLPLAAFALMSLLATLLHLDTFNQGRWPFLVWLALYVVTPVLVPLVWWLNRDQDAGAPEAEAPRPPAVVRRVLFILGLFLLAEAAILFLGPGIAADHWPWPLTPLTARVLAAWQVLLGGGALALAAEPRWSAWRIPLQSIAIWQALLLAALLLRRDAFGPGGPLNWFTLYTLAGLLILIGFYLAMERRTTRKRA